MKQFRVATMLYMIWVAAAQEEDKSAETQGVCADDSEMDALKTIFFQKFEIGRHQTMETSRAGTEPRPVALVDSKSDIDDLGNQTACEHPGRRRRAAPQCPNGYAHEPFRGYEHDGCCQVCSGGVTTQRRRYSCPSRCPSGYRKSHSCGCCQVRCTRSDDCPSGFYCDRFFCQKAPDEAICATYSGSCPFPQLKINSKVCPGGQCDQEGCCEVNPCVACHNSLDNGVCTLTSDGTCSDPSWTRYCTERGVKKVASCKAVGYCVSDLNHKDCVAGCERIENAAECAAAASKVGGTYVREFSNSYMPPGCTQSRTQSGSGYTMYFNTLAGAASPEYKTICYIQAGVCSNVSGGVSDTFPCACGVTINESQVCGAGEVCVATNGTDGQCKAAVCSNVSGGVSDTFPCACGVTINESQVCGAGEVCVATNGTDGQCKATASPTASLD